MKKQISTRDLPVKLTQDELENVAKETSMKIQELGEAEAEKKADAAKHKAIIDAIREEMERLAKMTETEYEERPIECEWMLSEDQETVELVRPDTGDIIDSRPARPEDYQENLLEQ